MNAKDEIIALIDSKEKIPKEKITARMACNDNEIDGALYALTDNAWYRIQPAMTMLEHCRFVTRYLLECLEKNPVETGSDEYLHSGFAAAWEIASWMKHLKSFEGADIVLTEIATGLETVYRRADEETRGRLICGSLEHIFEDEELTRLFDKWRSDPDLKEGYDAALGWGEAHR